MRIRPVAARLLRSVTAFLLAGLCVVGMTSTELHYLLVQHTVCAEHGELVHGAVEQRTPGLARIVSASGESRAASALPEAASQAHEHDHCGVVSRPSSAPHRIGCLPLGELAVFASPEAGHAQASQQPIDVVLLAPKTSPPV